MSRSIAIAGANPLQGKKISRWLSRESLEVVQIEPWGRAGVLQSKADFHVDPEESSAVAQLASFMEKRKVGTVVYFAPSPFLMESPALGIEAEFQGNRCLLSACEATSVKHFILMSSTMNYGPRFQNPAVLREDATLYGHADSRFVQLGIRMEEEVSKWSRETGIARTTILRTCWMIGPEVWNPVVRFFSRSLVPTWIGFDPLLQWIHEEDVLRILRDVIVEPRDGIFNLVGRGVLPLSTMLRLAGKRAVPLPGTMLKQLPLVPWSTHESREQVAFFEYLKFPWIASGEKMWAEFGEPMYSSQEAWMSFVTDQRLRRCA